MTNTTLNVPVSNSRALATFLNEHGMPGRRSMTAIERLRRERRNHRLDTPRATTLQERLYARIVAQASTEIVRRGGETIILDKNKSTPLSVADRDLRTGVTLLTASGWRYYSNRFGSRHTRLAYLFGVDDAGPWAVRVPGNTASVREGLEWVEPAAVRDARLAGRRVVRQGDVYAVETTAAHDSKGIEDLPASHEWRPGTRYLIHKPEDGRKHRPLKLARPVRFYRQRVLEMGRSGGRAYGD